VNRERAKEKPFKRFFPSRTFRTRLKPGVNEKFSTKQRQDAMGAKQKFLATSRLCVFALKIFPAEYAAPTGLKFYFGFGSTNMPRRRRWGRTPCQNHFAMDVWGSAGVSNYISPIHCS